LYVLPARDECLEAFQWLAKEIRDARGDAILMRVEHFEGLSDGELVELFNRARQSEYEEAAKQLTVLEKEFRRKKSADAYSKAREIVDKLRRRHAEIARIDYFASPAGTELAARISRFAQTLLPATPTFKPIRTMSLGEYRDARWLTRPHPYVDRLACAWLIRRFVNPRAVIRYGREREPGEIAFDMQDAEFGHSGNLCTFETMVAAFELSDPALVALSEIVHELDLRDGRYSRPENEGVDKILAGWLRAGFSDAELEAHGVALFEGLYSSFSGAPKGLKPGRKRRGKERT
jgi:hypothetical protein